MTRLQIIAPLAVAAALTACATTPTEVAASADCPARGTLDPALPWKPHPTAAGVRVQYLVGSPGAPGYFRYRLDLAPGFVLAPHSHGAALNMVVLCGAVEITRLDAAGEGKPVRFTPQSFARFEPGEPHAEASADGAVLEVTGVGPANLQWLKPAAGG
jgi:hypothetical protein